MKKILIIGSLGYLGSALFLKLKKKYYVTGVDTHFFSEAILSNAELNDEILKLDARKIDETFMKNFEVVILLAGISNDPIDSLNENDVYKPTFRYAVKLANICKKNYIKFIFPSSCSIYGFNKEIVNEESNPNPLTGYSKNKLEIEKYLISISDDKFKPIILRFATIYGLSPRMRFDIVINMLCGMAITKNKIILNSNGKSWRPHLNIEDALSAIEYSIEFDKPEQGPLILNVGQNSANVEIIEIAKIISKIVNCDIEFLDKSKLDQNELFNDRKILKSNDIRSYRVNFDKIMQIYINFKFEYNVFNGINDLLLKLKLNKLNEKLFLKKEFYRLQQLEYLYKSGLIDKNLEYKND